MPVSVSIKAANLKSWAANGRKTADSLNSRPVTRQLNLRLGKAWRDIAREAFETEGASTQEGRWQPLSAEYARRKAQIFGGQSILRATDSMFNSLVSPGGQNIASGRNRPSGYTFRFGSSEPKLPFHVAGTPNMPRRTPLDPTGTQLLDLSNLMGLVIVTEFLKLGWIDGVQGARMRNTGFDNVRVP